MKFLVSASKAGFLGAQVDPETFSTNHQYTSLDRPWLRPRPLLFPVYPAAFQECLAEYTLRPLVLPDSFLVRGVEYKRFFQLRNIGKEEMEEIVEDYEGGGRQESGYLIMDVREFNEVADTGKISPNTQTLPLSLISQRNVFAMDEEEFEENCGFPKPSPDETLVLSCRSGVRSVNAAQFAAMHGYTQLVNYKGGANEWFS